MNTEMQSGKDLLGFLSLFETAAGDGYLGAILITDLFGVPAEFRCTHCVKPTAVQETLYGDTLEPHIATNLCGIPLLKKIETKPALVIVNKDYLIQVRSEFPFPVLLIKRAGEAFETKIPEARIRLDCPTGKFQPIIVEPNPKYKDDSEVAREVLQSAFTNLDPLEPFDRMARAVEQLGKQDKRFQ